MAQANKESEEREFRMTREIERLLSDHDNTYAHTMTSLDTRLDAKSDLMMRKLDEILNVSNREERSAQGSVHARQTMEMEHATKPGRSKVRNRTTNLSKGGGPGHTHRGQVGQTRPRQMRVPSRR